MPDSLAGDRPGCLVIVSGLPGSGKTTEATRLERERTGVRFCPDEWMTHLGVSVWDDAARERIEALQWQIARQVLRSGGTAIIEWGTWGRDERVRLCADARELGARAELLLLEPPVDELWRRIQERDAEDPPLRHEDLLEWHAFVQGQRPDAAELSGYDALLTAPRP